MGAAGMFPDLFVIKATDEHTHTIILLHGRGSSGPAFAEELLESRSSAGMSLTEHFPNHKWLFPTSEDRLSVTFQEAMTQWFDIRSLTDPERESSLQIEGISSSLAHIVKLIRSEAEAIPSHRIILGGISQGCATGIITMLSGLSDFGAFIGFCSWIPFESNFRGIGERVSQAPLETRSSLQELCCKRFLSTMLNPSACNSKQLASNQSQRPGTKIFLAHSRDDDVVDFRFGVSCRNTLQALNYEVEWREYEDGGHWINVPQGIDHLIAFLKTIAPG